MSNPSATAPVLTAAPQDLSGLNTLGLVSMAQACVTLDDVAQLPSLSELAAGHASLLVLGGGSNLVLPEAVPGLVARVALRGVRLLRAEPDAWLVEAAGGETWHGFVAECVRQGWDGLENLALIPGTVGAAPVQNIGAYGVELADRFHSLTAWDVRAGRYVEMTAADCRFAYRDSVFKHEPPGGWVIVAVRLRLPRPWRPVLAYPDLQRHPGLVAGNRPRAPSSMRSARSGAPSCRIPPLRAMPAAFSRIPSSRPRSVMRCSSVSQGWFPMRNRTGVSSLPRAG